jgi:hypothetical protein
MAATNTIPAHKTPPKGTLVKGNQITDPFTAETVPVDAYQTPAINQNSLQEIQNAKTGGLIHLADGGLLPMKEERLRGHNISAHPNLTSLGSVPLFADGGSIPGGHNPQFFSEGGLNSVSNTYVKGDGDGTSDSVAAMLANGEFVIPADVVSDLGNGSNDSGAAVLQEFLKTVREHKRKADAKHLPPDSKGVLGYLLNANKKVK